MLGLFEVQKLVKVIRALGGDAYLAGGAVRDYLLNREVKDYDLEVYGLEPDELRRILELFAKSAGVKLDCVGQSFQVYKLGLNLDVSLPRRDRKVSEGHKGFIVEGDPNLSFEEACRRRDFTINAMLMDPLSKRLIDPFGGVLDLELKNLKMVDAETFVEDSLRALRAVQFASRFGLDIDPKTREVIEGMDLSDLPRERVWGEVEKLLMQSPKPNVGMFELHLLKIDEKLFPELRNLVGCPQEQQWHPEGDVFVHTALALDVAKDVSKDLPYPKQVTVMLATLVHDLGKAETTEFIDGRWRALGHAEAGVSLARNMLDRLNVHSIDGYDVRSQVLELVRYHLVPGEWHRVKDKVSDAAFRRLAQKVDLELLHLVFRADSESRNVNSLGIVFDTEAQDWFIERVKALNIEEGGPKKILMGRHLVEMGVPPGKTMGKILERVFELQLDGTVTNLGEAKSFAHGIWTELKHV